MNNKKDITQKNPTIIHNSNMFIASKSKELRALSIAVISGNRNSIARQVKRAYKAGAKSEEIFEVISNIMRDKRSLNSINKYVNSIINI